MRNDEDSFLMSIWSQGKGVLVPTIVSVAIWAATLSSLPSQVKENTCDIKKLDTRTTIVETKFENIQESLKRIERKLDK